MSMIRKFEIPLGVVSGQPLPRIHTNPDRSLLYEDYLDHYHNMKTQSKVING